MTCRADTVGFWSYRACPDDPPVAADRLRAVVRWQAVDEISQSGPDLDYTIQTDALGLTPRVSRDGIMGLVGNPVRLYPGLDTATVDLAFTLYTPGYLPRELAVIVGPVVGFPNSFTPAKPTLADPDGNVALHRDAIVLRGRTVQLVPGQLDPVPVPLVPIAIIGTWWVFPPANVDPDTVIEPANLVSLHPGLYTDRATTGDSVVRRDLAHVAGQDKTLVAPVVRGETTARISDRVGVVGPGTVLAFEPSRPDRVEYVHVTLVNGASTDDQPATVTLAYRLQLDHEQGTDVQVVTPQAPAAASAFVRDGIRSDRVAFLAGMAGVTAGVVEIVGTTVFPEYQTASLYSTTSDSNGLFRLPPLSRVASVKLQTPALKLVTSPDYGRYENLVDLVNP
ncbi:MAG: hypothetical protein ABI467_00550 [Kofleriaceae bacterium]